VENEMTDPNAGSREGERVVVVSQFASGNGEWGTLFEAVGILHDWLACMEMQDIGWAAEAKLLTTRTKEFLERSAKGEMK